MSDMNAILSATVDAEARRFKVWTDRMRKARKTGRSTKSTQRLIDRYLIETQGFWLMKLPPDRQRKIGFDPGMMPK